MSDSRVYHSQKLARPWSRGLVAVDEGRLIGHGGSARPLAVNIYVYPDPLLVIEADASIGMAIIKLSGLPPARPSFHHHTSLLPPSFVQPWRDTTNHHRPIRGRLTSRMIQRVLPLSLVMTLPRRAAPPVSTTTGAC